MRDAAGYAPSGSSPREWGTPMLPDLRHASMAGSSPREWGTRAADSRHDADVDGSSPREWGTRYKGLRALSERFIPTRVGNTASCSRRKFAPPVHPHASGEHSCRHLRSADVLNGSSPREWGTRALRAQRVATVSVHPHASGEHTSRRHRQVDLRRFIPTRVGNTTMQHAMSQAQSVHPHASGEHDANAVSMRCACGSSPREWGTPTAVSLKITLAATVHPHASGEHAIQSCRCSAT